MTLKEDTAGKRHINCARCGQDLPESAYYKGRYRLCRECTKSRARGWYEDNRDHRLASQRAWREGRKPTE